ncbi:hypothetical protein [Paenibacillus sp. TY11]|uniref:hypothetical protein n=1 Tax=Paenibacillus sp. TY11 TaxID=3448633 RepID=UPI00403A57C1
MIIVGIGMGVFMTGKMTDGLAGIRGEFTNIPADRFRQLSNPQAMLQPELKADIPPELPT